MWSDLCDAFEVAPPMKGRQSLASTLYEQARFAPLSVLRAAAGGDHGETRKNVGTIQYSIL